MLPALLGWCSSLKKVGIKVDINTYFTRLVFLNISYLHAHLKLHVFIAPINHIIPTLL